MEWSEWVEIESAKERHERFNRLGIYQIRAIDYRSKPISIPRINATDRTGIIYFGRSGNKSQNSKRTIAKRLKEFLKPHHSGGQTYLVVKHVVRNNRKFRGLRLQVRAMILSFKKISKAEQNVIHKYLLDFGELPPCNSAIPGKKYLWRKYLLEEV